MQKCRWYLEGVFVQDVYLKHIIQTHSYILKNIHNTAWTSTNTHTHTHITKQTHLKHTLTWHCYSDMHIYLLDFLSTKVMLKCNMFPTVSGLFSIYVF